MRVPEDTSALGLPLISLNRLEKHANYFRILSVPLRIRILDYLDLAGTPQYVTRIVEQCDGAVQAVVSQHLGALRDAGIVGSERDGNRVFYRIIDPGIRPYLAFLREGGFSKTGV